MEVHNPLFRLALDQPDCAHVLVEAVTHASVAPPFLPPWKPALDGTEARETVDSKRLDFVLALFCLWTRVFRVSSTVGPGDSGRQTRRWRRRSARPWRACLCPWA